MVWGEAVAVDTKKGRVIPAFFDRATSRGVARRLSFARSALRVSAQCACVQDAAHRAKSRYS